jgi:glycosyltransferase involved in cell wall biosynthesis
MKVLLINDNPLKKHPFGKLLIEDLEKKGFEIILATSDEKIERSIYDFTRQMIYHKNRKKKLRRFKHISLVKYYLKFDRLSSKIVNRYFWRKIVHIKAIFKILKYDADVVIASRANVIGAVFFYRLKNYNKKIKYFYLPFEIYGKQTVKSSMTLRIFEKFCIRYIFKYIITQSNLRAEYYRRINSGLVIIVCRNYKKIKSNYSLAVRHAPKVNLIYLGLIQNGRSLDTLIRSLDFLPSEYVLTFVGPTRDNWIIANKDLVEYYATQGKFQIKNEIREEEIGLLFAHFNIGLISYDNSCLNNMLCCPAKLTDYLHSGLSVIAPNLPGMQELALLNTDIELFNYASPQSLANVILKVNKSARTRDDIMTDSQTMSWESEFQKIFDNLIQ